ncbi:serine hydrolase domain-containing protein [Streptomyces sp. NPDC002669]|uniref:serine hydrolase domain-containing protein n=1 Tax=Streptomyces sp. NPDC002669 TaxID=3364658 RepID=UPI00367F9D93
MTVSLSEQDQSVLRTAAYGAVTLISAADAAGSPHKAATEGAAALAATTGPIGHVLARNPKRKDLTGASVAEIADRVLPALTEAVVLLRRQLPSEAENFRRAVRIAVTAASAGRSGEPGPSVTEMARRITEALDAADEKAVKGTAGEDPSHRPELLAAAQAFVDAGFGGIQMRVHDERGQWSGSAGVRASGTTAPPPADGHFWIGSTTKTFTATLVLQLVDEGRLSLDGPVADHLPSFGLDPRITVRMLLRHTSGLYNYTGELTPEGEFEPGIDATGRAWAENRLRAYTPEELVRFALSRPPLFEPGTDQSYANTNYTLALLLIEKAAACTYAEALERRIVRPLGLTGTIAPTADTVDLPEPHSHGYFRYQDGEEWRTVDVTRQNSSLLAGAGHLISTTPDLQVFLSALLGGRLLPATMLDEMCTPHGKLGLGLGLWVQELDPERKITVVHHNGGAPGGFGSLMVGTPDGRRTLTAGLTTGESATDPASAFPEALGELLGTVFLSD